LNGGDINWANGAGNMYGGKGDGAEHMKTTHNNNRK